MSQQEIIKIMKQKKDQWFSSKKLAKLTKNSQSSVNRNARHMLKFGEIEVIKKLIGRYWINFYKLKE